MGFDGPSRSWSAAAVLEDSSLETCCVCLDSLSSAPVVLLLADTAPPAPARACPHYVHFRCAELLNPRKCPLCRAPFVTLSEPIDRGRFGTLLPRDVVSCLRQLSRAPPGEPATAPTQTVVDLLVAAWPVPEASLWEAIEELSLEAENGEIGAEGLEQLMEHFGMHCATGSRARADGSSPDIRRVSYTLTTRLWRRLNWALLKAAGAAGASIFCGGCGLGLGVAAGGVLAIPRKRIPYMDGDELVLAVKTAWLLCLAVYHGAQRTDLVCKGLRWGTGFGLVFGCFHGLVHVDPERHGIRSVFWTGVTGQATLGALFGWRHPLSTVEYRGVPRIDVFKPPPL